jgi:hypothetical protein
MLYGLRIPSPEPIGAASGITAAQPASASRLAATGSSLVYAATMNLSATTLGRVEQLHRSGRRGGHRR